MFTSRMKGAGRRNTLPSDLKCLTETHVLRAVGGHPQRFVNFVNRASSGVIVFLALITGFLTPAAGQIYNQPPINPESYRSRFVLSRPTVSPYLYLRLNETNPGLPIYQLGIEPALERERRVERQRLTPALPRIDDQQPWWAQQPPSSDQLVAPDRISRLANEQLWSEAEMSRFQAQQIERVARQKRAIEKRGELQRKDSSPPPKFDWDALLNPGDAPESGNK